MIKKEENKRKGIIYLVIGVVTLLLLVSGVAYAYFQAQNDDGKSANLDATTGTTDVLSFLMTDIDTTDGNVIDNHNRDSENENEKIVINATQDNFGQNDKSLGDGVSAKAILKANNTNNIAEQKYNVFFVIEEPRERLIYTQDENHPELILTVIDPTGTELKNIEGLKYHNADPDNSNDVSGFDITGRVGSFAIVKDYKIEVEEGNGNHQTEQEWKIKVTLVNLKENQNNNTGKEINGEVVITQEEMETYKQAHITSIKDTSSTVNSITTTMDYEKGSKEIKNYYFGIEEVGEVVAVDLEEVKWEEDDDATHTFNGLKDNYKYKIYCYIEDTEGIKSNIYETKVENLVTTEKLPKVKEIKVTSKSYDEIVISVETEKGTYEITNYEYTIKGATIETGERVEETTLSTHTFNGLNELQDYTIEVRVKDSKGNYSVVRTIKETTLQKKTYTLLATNTTIEGQDTTLTNIMEDGSFENELTNYENIGNSIHEFVDTNDTHGNKMLKIFNQNSVDKITHFINNNAPVSILNHCYYSRMMFKSSDSFSSMDSRYNWVSLDRDSVYVLLDFKNIKTNDWLLLSGIIKNETENSDWVIDFFVRGSNSDVYLDELMLIDITDSYGENILTQEWLDTNLIYFDGTANMKTIETGENEVKFKVTNGTGSIRCNNGGEGSINSDGTVTITGKSVNTTCVIE